MLRSAVLMNTFHNISPDYYTLLYDVGAGSVTVSLTQG